MIETGGRTSQLRAAPHVMAANESIAVGSVNRNLSLCRFSRGGCCDEPSWLIMVARAVYVAVRAVAVRNNTEIIMLVGEVFDSSIIGSFE